MKKISLIIVALLITILFQNCGNPFDSHSKKNKYKKNVEFNIFDHNQQLITVRSPYTISGNDVIVGGDMIIGQTNEFNFYDDSDNFTQLEQKPSIRKALKRNENFDKSKNWILNYKIDTTTFTTERISKLKPALNNLDNFLKNKQIGIILNEVSTEEQLIIEGDLHFNGGRATVKAPWEKNMKVILSDGNEGNRYLVFHEFFHIFGLKHEQQRSDRDFYIDIILDNVKSGFAGNFSMISGLEPFGPYDKKSIMHYWPRNFAKEGLYSITNKDGSTTGIGGSVPSVNDIAALQHYYPLPLCGDQSERPCCGLESDIDLDGIGILKIGPLKNIKCTVVRDFKVQGQVVPQYKNKNSNWLSYIEVNDYPQCDEIDPLYQSTQPCLHELPTNDQTENSDDENQPAKICYFGNKEYPCCINAANENGWGYENGNSCRSNDTNDNEQEQTTNTYEQLPRNCSFVILGEKYITSKGLIRTAQRITNPNSDWPYIEFAEGGGQSCRK